MPRDNYRMIVVGAGGIGSWLSEGLVRMLEYKAPGSMLVIVDGDHYEDKNKERQNFKGMGNKAEVLVGNLSEEFTNTVLVPLPQWVVEEVKEIDPEDVEEDGSAPAGRIAAKDLLGEWDIVYAVVDNFKARKDICDAAREFDNIDVFTAGNEDTLFGSTYLYRRRDGVDITEHPSVRSEEYVNPPDRNPGEMSCAERAEIEGGTQLIAANFGVASYLLGQTQRYIIDDEVEWDNEEEGYQVPTDIKFDLGLGLTQGYDRRAVTVTVDA